MPSGNLKSPRTNEENTAFTHSAGFQVCSLVTRSLDIITNVILQTFADFPGYKSIFSTAESCARQISGRCRFFCLWLHADTQYCLLPLTKLCFM